jgi:optic atrophy protein 1
MNFIFAFIFRDLELDRDELFEKARGEILNEVVSLSQVSVKDWEEKLRGELWKSISHYIFEHVYLPAGYSVNQTNSSGKDNILPVFYFNSNPTLKNYLYKLFF